MTQTQDAYALSLGQVLAQSGYFSDARDAAQAAVKVLAGAELGLGPVASMRGVDIIKGEVSLSAGLVSALVRRSDRYDYAISRWDDGGCTLVFSRDGQALDPASTFTVEDAQRAGLHGDNWKKYPRNMCFARAMTNGARLHCPDLFAGSVYVPEELLGDQALPPATQPAAIDNGHAGELPSGAATPAPPAVGAAAADTATAAAPPAPTASPSPDTRAPGDPITEDEAARLRELADLHSITPAWLSMTLVNLGVDDVSDPQAALATLTVGQGTQLMEAINRRG